MKVVIVLGIYHIRLVELIILSNPLAFPNVMFSAFSLCAIYTYDLLNDMIVYMCVWLCVSDMRNRQEIPDFRKFSVEDPKKIFFSFHLMYSMKQMGEMILSFHLKTF